MKNNQPLEAAQNEGEKNNILVYKKNRRCKKKDCRQLLSMYNPGPCCNVHVAWWVDKEEKAKEGRQTRQAKQAQQARYYRQTQ